MRTLLTALVLIAATPAFAGDPMTAVGRAAGRSLKPAFSRFFLRFG